MAILRALMLSIALALATVVVGWWAVPVIAAVYGLLARHTTRPGLVAALAGVASWGGYLWLISTSGAPVGRLGRDFASALSLPAWGPFVATLVFPAVLAGCAAVLAASLGRVVVPNRRKPR